MLSPVVFYVKQCLEKSVKYKSGLRLAKTELFFSATVIK